MYVMLVCIYGVYDTVKIENCFLLKTNICIDV